MELEALLGKERILEIYLNNVEWGEGVFGARGGGAAATFTQMPPTLSRRRRRSWR